MFVVRQKLQARSLHCVISYSSCIEFLEVDEQLYGTMFHQLYVQYVVVCARTAAASTTNPQYLAYSNAVLTYLQISAISKIFGSLTLAVTVKIYVCTLQKV